MEVGIAVKEPEGRPRLERAHVTDRRAEGREAGQDPGEAGEPRELVGVGPGPDVDDEDAVEGDKPRVDG